jgi:hypothetical protein
VCFLPLLLGPVNSLKAKDSIYWDTMRLAPGQGRIPFFYIVYSMRGERGGVKEHIIVR